MTHIHWEYLSVRQQRPVLRGLKRSVISLENQIEFFLYFRHFPLGVKPDVTYIGNKNILILSLAHNEVFSRRNVDLI